MINKLEEYFKILERAVGSASGDYDVCMITLHRHDDYAERIVPEENPNLAAAMPRMRRKLVLLRRHEQQNLQKWNNILSRAHLVDSKAHLGGEEPVEFDLTCPVSRAAWGVPDIIADITDSGQVVLKLEER